MKQLFNIKSLNILPGLSAWAFPGLDSTRLFVEKTDAPLEERWKLMNKLAYPYQSVEIQVAKSFHQEALDLLSQNTIGKVLMDAQMPVMNGFETTKAIREKK